MSQPQRQYAKHFIPLENDPELFTQLFYSLGGSESLAFHEVYTLDDQDLLALIPRPVHAVILLFPASDKYEAKRDAEDQILSESIKRWNPEQMNWFKQTIHNACGLYGILHAACNGIPSRTLTEGSILGQLVVQPRDKKTKFLEDSVALEEAYKSIALQGQTEAPQSVEDEVDYHYICFTRSPDGHVYELDGDRSGPVDRGEINDEDMLSGESLALIKKFVEGIGVDQVGFGMMVLADSDIS